MQWNKTDTSNEAGAHRPEQQECGAMIGLAVAIRRQTGQNGHDDQ